MQAIEYIKNGLEDISKQFPFVQIRYAFNYEINTHIIQFDPMEAYYNLPELDASWIPFSIEFDSIFEDESIAFIGSDSLLSIGDHYDLSWNIQPIDLTFQYFKELLEENDFRTIPNTLPDTINWHPDLLQNSNFIFSSFEFNITKTSLSPSFYENSIVVPKVDVPERNNDLIQNEKYAMAA